MPLKMGAPRTIDPSRVRELIQEMEQSKVDWSYPQLATILSQEVGRDVTAAAVSKCARTNGIIRSKLPGRKAS